MSRLGTNAPQQGSGRAMRLQKMTVRRWMGLIGGLAVVLWLLDQPRSTSITAYHITVHVISTRSPIDAVFCQATEEKTQAELLGERWMKARPIEPGDCTVDANPFDGEPLELQVNSPRREASLLRTRKDVHLRDLFVGIRYRDGRCAFKVVDLPGPDATHIVHVSFP